MATTYTCPMHPEIVSDTPGRCPKCKMALVPSGTQAQTIHHNEDRGLGKLTWRSYIPLIVIVLMIAAAAIVAAWRTDGIEIRELVTNAMTGFFLVFGGFKLMDLRGFAEGYSTYDLLAQRARMYGYIYPFIELAFGFSMLAGFHPDWLLWAELGVMVFSGIGVAIKLIKKERFQCACLGTFLKVPLTYVTLVEDFGMAVLALILLQLT